MKKFIIPAILFIALINDACPQSTAGYVFDSTQPECQIFFDIQTLESYPPQYRFIPSSIDTLGWCYWDFGDGTGLYENATFHRFENSGYYTVCLTAKDSMGCKATSCTTAYFEGRVEGCKANWTGYPFDPALVSSVISPDSFVFTGLYSYMFYDQSEGIPVSWHWSFGDGTESYEQHPFHTYAGPGVYTVCLEILTADSCTGQYCDSVWVGIQQSCSLFGTVLDYSGLDACGLVIQLDEGPILEPVEIVPDFVLRPGQRVMLSFTELSNFASACMAGKIVRIDCIQEVSECHAYFWHHQLDWVSSLPPVYQFVSDTSQTIVHWQWDLGDGTVSFEKSPTHRYEFSGYYTICLTTTDASKCSDTYCLTDYFEGRHPEPGLCDYRLSIQTEMIVGPAYPCEGSASISLLDASGNTAEAKSIWWSTGAEEDHVEGLCSNTEYQVTAIDPDGCYLTGSFLFGGGGSMPYDTLWGNWEYEKYGLEYAFSMPVYGAGYNCVWEFGDGNVSQGSVVNHTYTEEGEYTVILKVYDNQGNIAYAREIAIDANDETGIPNRPGKIIMDFYPVPASEVLYIEFNTQAQCPATLAVFSMAGQQVMTGEINIPPSGPYIHVLEIAGLPAGVYCGQMRSSGGMYTSFRFIK